MSIVEQAKDFIQPAIIGAVAYLFTSISDLKHTTDIGGVERKQNTSELNDVWMKYNKNEEDEKEEMQKEFDFALKLIEQQHALALEVKDLKIEFLEKDK